MNLKEVRDRITKTLTVQAGTALTVLDVKRIVVKDGNIGIELVPLKAPVKRPEAKTVPAKKAPEKKTPAKKAPVKK
jgi:hypothetical protein